MKVAKEASPAEQPPLPQAPVGGASPVPEGPAPDTNTGEEFNDGDMGEEMPPMDNPQGAEGMEEPPMDNDMGNPEGDMNDPKFMELQNIWNGLNDEDKEAGIKYLESMKKDETSPSSMPPVDAGQEQMPMQEKVIFKKRQLEELMKRK